MAAATTSSEESEATIASPSSVARHNPLRQTLSLPQQSNSQLTVRCHTFPIGAINLKENGTQLLTPFFGHSF